MAQKRPTKVKVGSISFKKNKLLIIFIKLVSACASFIKILTMFFNKPLNPTSIGTEITIIPFFFVILFSISIVLFILSGLKCSKTSLTHIMS